MARKKNVIDRIEKLTSSREQRALRDKERPDKNLAKLKKRRDGAKAGRRALLDRLVKHREESLERRAARELERKARREAREAKRNARRGQPEEEAFEDMTALSPSPSSAT